MNSRIEMSSVNPRGRIYVSIFRCLELAKINITTKNPKVLCNSKITCMNSLLVSIYKKLYTLHKSTNIFITYSQMKSTLCPEGYCPLHLPKHRCLKTTWMEYQFWVCGSHSLHQCPSAPVTDSTHTGWWGWCGIASLVRGRALHFKRELDQSKGDHFSSRRPHAHWENTG